MVPLLVRPQRPGRRGDRPDDEIRAVGQGLLDRWDQPGRHFHNLRHLADVLGRVDELSQETHDPDLVRLAAWYHGAIFDAKGGATYANKGGEDETASAALADAELTRLGVPEPAVRRVAHLVNALVRHAPDASDFDCAVLCDADLAMLAAEPQRYKEYLKDVRDEYAHIPKPDYVRARIAILTKLLDRRTLFRARSARPGRRPRDRTSTRSSSACARSRPSSRRRRRRPQPPAPEPPSTGLASAPSGTREVGLPSSPRPGTHQGEERPRAEGRRRFG